MCFSDWYASRLACNDITCYSEELLLDLIQCHYFSEAGIVDGEPWDDASTRGPTPLPQSTVIATAISVAVLVLLSAVLFITIICCCVIVKSVKNMQQKSHPVFQEHSVELDYNPAYRDEHSNEHHQQSEPYYSLVTEVQGGVSDTRDSYVEIQPNYADNAKWPGFLLMNLYSVIATRNKFYLD